MSDENFSIMGALRQGKADADTITQIGGGVSKGVFGIVKIALGVPIMMSFGVDALLRHSFGSRYFSIVTWLASLFGFVVFAAIFVPEEEAPTIEFVLFLLLLAGPTHLIHRLVRSRRVRLHSGFPGESWIPWRRVMRWDIGYWLPLALFDPLVACGVGVTFKAAGFVLGWYFIVGGVTSAIRHTYWAWIDHQRRVDQQDATMEAEGAAAENDPGASVLPSEVVTGAGGAWLAADHWESRSESVGSVRH